MSLFSGLFKTAQILGKPFELKGLKRAAPAAAAMAALNIVPGGQALGLLGLYGAVSVVKAGTRKAHSRKLKKDEKNLHKFWSDKLGPDKAEDLKLASQLKAAQENGKEAEIVEVNGKRFVKLAGVAATQFKDKKVSDQRAEYNAKMKEAEGEKVTKSIKVGGREFAATATTRQSFGDAFGANTLGMVPTTPVSGDNVKVDTPTQLSKPEFDQHSKQPGGTLNDINEHVLRQEAMERMAAVMRAA